MVEPIKIQDGFKNTEVGIIPNDWDEKTFKDICWVNQGLQIPISSRFILPNKNSKIYITIQYLNQGKAIAYIDDYLPSVCCSKDDILMTRTGNTGIVVSGVEGVFHNNFFKINFDKEKIDKDFLIYYLSQSKIKKIILAKAGTSTIPDLNHSDFYSIPITLPPTKVEQTAIATALKDADGIISQLEKQLTKKRNIKVGVLQDLLKPKKDWIWTAVEKLGKPYGGLSGKSKTDFKDGNSPYIPFMNIMSNPIIDTTYFDYVKIGTTESQNKAIKGDLFFNGSSETPEEVGMCSVLLNDIPSLYLNSFCFGFRLFKEQNTDGLYLAYFFRSSYGRKIFYTLSQGATRHNLSKSNFMKIEFHIPKPDEQKRIAGILRDIDNEIFKLENKIEKHKMMKQGMMQSLLTGKVRLI